MTNVTVASGLAMLWCVARSLDAQVVMIPGTPSCPNCRIVAESLFSLGSVTDSVRPTTLGNVERDSRGRLYTISDDRRVVVVFDPRGTLIGTIGRRGPGPGEFPSQLWRVHIGANDSVYAATERQISVFDRDWRFARQLRLPTMAFTVLPLTGGGFVAGMSIPAQDPRRPFHILNPDGSVSRSFGPDLPPLGGRGRPRASRTVTGSSPFVLAADRQSIWVSGPQHFLERWTLEGRMLERQVIDAPWFKRDSDAVWDSVVRGRSVGYFTRSGVPNSHFVGVDPSGLFWYMGSIPVPGTIGTMDKPQPRTWRVEVIDVAARRIVASVIEPSRYFERMVPGTDLAVTSTANADGELTLTIWRVRLQRP